MAGPLYYDRVQETTSTTGTGTYTLSGATTGYQAFSVVGNGNTCYYAITDGTNWEVGLGTYTLSGTTLARTSILSSSNSNAAVNWASGAKNIWLDAPASFFGPPISTTSGGTGLSAPTANSVLMTNGASALQTIAPSTSGNALRSNGTTWVSAAPMTLGTVVTPVAVSSIDVTGFPTGVRRITIDLSGISVNASGTVVVQIGNGSIVTTGYSGTSVTTGAANALTTISATAGFCFSGASAGNATSPCSGTITLTLLDATNNIWTCAGVTGQPGVTGINAVGGVKTLSSALDRIRLTTVSGTPTFNAGSFNTTYEF